MSKIGIGLFYFALVGAACAAFFGYMLVQKYNTSQANLSTTKQSLVVSQAATAKAKQETVDMTQKRDDLQGQLTAETSKADELNTKLTTAQKSADDLNTQLTAAKADVDKAQADLKHVNDVLGMTPEEMKAKADKAQADLTAAQSQQKILEDEYQAAQTEVASLHDDINRSKLGTMPQGISGKVTFVNRPWNFVVLNVGLSNGVVPNGILILYRGRNFLGKVRVTSAEDNTSVADILPNAKGDIQVGDDVLN